MIKYDNSLLVYDEDEALKNLSEDEIRRHRAMINEQSRINEIIFMAGE